MRTALSASFFALLVAACAGGSASPGPQTQPTGGDASSPVDAGHDAASDARGPTDGPAPVDAPADAHADAPPSCGPAPGGGSATVHTIGRFDTGNPAGPKFAWPGSTVAATFTGTGISAKLADNVGNNELVVVVDGAAPTSFHTKSGTSTYPLATGLAAGQHTLSLVKRTESYDGVLQLLALTPTAGALVPTPEPWARRIELIGDSITCGYGALGGACTNPSVEDEDWTVTAGALLAAELHAEPTTIAYSGIGMVRDGNGNTTDQMSTRFLLTLADDPSSTWGFTTPPPDVVVIDLGTNDFAKGDPGPSFQTTYVSFVQKVLRPRYPDAFVIVANGPMLNGTSRAQCKTYLTGAVSALNQAGDAKVVFFEYDAETTMGCQYHPDVATNQAMAAKIAPVITQLTGWCP